MARIRASRTTARELIWTVYRSLYVIRNPIAQHGHVLLIEIAQTWRSHASLTDFTNNNSDSVGEIEAHLLDADLVLLHIRSWNHSRLLLPSTHSHVFPKPQPLKKSRGFNTLAQQHVYTHRLKLGEIFDLPFLGSLL